MKIGLSTILEARKPDLIVSGINYGKNTSVNVIYSGTVAAATEGYLFGIPSFALSLATYDIDYDVRNVARLAAKIIKQLTQIVSGKKLLLNVNIPCVDEIKGVIFTKCSKSYWNDQYERRVDPFGREYFWFAGDYCSNELEPYTDDWAVANGYVSITPLKFEFTDLEALETFGNIKVVI